MIKTSRFANVGFFSHQETAISISRWPPSWYFGKSFHTLAPPGDLVLAAKAGQVDQDGYEQAFQERVLDQLDVHEVLAQLKQIADNPILLCYEDLTVPGEWCHRRLVARWLSDGLSEDIPEWSKPTNVKSRLVF